jgi:hypothetical protein
MHYAEKLKLEIEKRDNVIREFEARISHFREHLELDKFKGVDDDGDRKDWIATGDVGNFLNYIWAARYAVLPKE